MACYVSTGSGNWSNSATWSPSGVPGDGDVVIYGANGASHVITVDQNVTVGISGKAYAVGAAITWSTDSGLLRASALPSTAADGDVVVVIGATGTDAAQINNKTWVLSGVSGGAGNLAGSNSAWSVSGGTAEFPAAIKRTGNGSSGGGLRFADGVTLTVKGDVIDAMARSTYLNGAHFVGMGAGCHLVGQADGPVGYVLGAAASSRPNCHVIITGTSGSRAGFRSGASGSNFFRLSDRSLSDTIGITASYCDFSRLGSASLAGIQTRIATNYTSRPVHFLNCTFDNTGGILHSTAIAVDQDARYEYCKFTNTLGTYSIQGSWTTTPTTGVRTLKFCYLDKRIHGIGIPTTGTSMGGFVIEDNLFEDSANFINTTQPWSSYKRNWYRKLDTGDWTVSGPTLEDTGIFWDTDGQNPHFIKMPTQRNVTIDGALINPAGQYSSGTGNGDILLPAAGDLDFVWTGVVSIPCPDGYHPGVVTTFGTGHQDNRISFYQNTVFVAATACLNYSETGTNPYNPNMVERFDSNLIWHNGAAFTTHQGTAINPPVDAQKWWNYADDQTVDTCPAAALDYNAMGPGYAATDASFASSGRGYHANWTTLPGAHDIDVLYPDWAGPTFVDRERNAVFYDVDGLGNPAETPWGSGATYTAGQKVSHSAANWWAGRSVNFRAIAAVPSGIEPMVTAGWRNYWRFEVWCLMVDGVPTGSTIASDVYNWVRAGFVPVEPSNALRLSGGGLAGVDIGAMPVSVTQVSSGRRRALRGLLL